ncbi:hypothetical protein BT63DRAFT_419768 [Microthyrium microscopicum]|uniref:Histone deacetylase interacting domain-containing protein n=1 Tax=Microthyrium microscopicum TaxID=703497 RepID=A0A6A6UTU5_9PEZI|nr:hypothetical protein BT63DRAFT_419768 [Microthyrium microscopicum]
MNNQPHDQWTSSNPPVPQTSHTTSPSQAISQGITQNNSSSGSQIPNFYPTSSAASQSLNPLAALASLQQNAPTLHTRPHEEHPQAHQYSPPNHQTRAYPVAVSAAGSAQFIPQAISESQHSSDHRETTAMEDIRRQAEQREREMRERQSNGEPQILHQPVALAPSARVLGPNGILGGQASLQQIPQMQPQQVFAMAQPQNGQPIPQSQASHLLMPGFNPNGQGAPLNQAQQPILNDALSYLDQVKIQFQTQPDVYNRFLDIMKDFKSGAIDTPGVIERVSQLFVGNPDLIQGFNTFLPPGYKIECGGDDPNAIRVTTPQGSTIHQLQARPPSPPYDQRSQPQHEHAQGGNERAYYDRPQFVQQLMGPQGQSFPSDGRATIANFAQQQGPGMPISPEGRRDQPGPPMSQDQRSLAALQQASAPLDARGPMGRHLGAADIGNIAGAVGLMNGSAAAVAAAGNAADKQRGPVEFNHAINYVNKIKNRFATQPDIYKQFLEILQTYQRESKPIGEVYNQVTTLFRSAPDLLQDFKQFLPDSAAHANAVAAGRKDDEEAFPLSNMRGGPGGGYGPMVAQTMLQQSPPRANDIRLPPVGNFGPTPSSGGGKKRNRADRQQTGGATPGESSTGARTGQPSGSAQSKKHRADRNLGFRQMNHSDSGFAPMMTNPSTIANLVSVPNEKDFHMLDKIRKHINNKNTFHEFIKLLNLFTQDQAEPQYIITRAAEFLGNNSEYMNWMKGLFNLEEFKSKLDFNNEDRITKTQLNRCRAYGPSYRKLPVAEHTQLCSGRDELCKSVLNDEWASHPTMQSEEAGFVAHRKTSYEESLHRIEEERHDYDSNIDCLVRTIQLLDPIVRAFTSNQNQNPDAPRQYQVDSKLGGQSETIYKRTIYKLYGREQGNSVITQLMSNPQAVAPLLLARFKDTLEKWKAAQRQWNEVWRQQTLASYHKSLDYQGSTVRNGGDRKAFAPKQVIAEIKVRFEEQKNAIQLHGRKDRLNDPQYKCEFKNSTVLKDAQQLVESQLNDEAADTVIGIKKLFRALFDGEDAPALGQSEASGSASPSSKTSQKAPAESLRRTAVTRAGRSGASAPESRATTPGSSNGGDDNVIESAEIETGETETLAMESWYKPTPVTLGGEQLPHAKPFNRTEYSLYCHNNLFVFFRLFTILYERLDDLYNYENRVVDLVKIQLADKPARDLGMLEREPKDYWAVTTPSSAENSFYRQMVEKFDSHLLDNSSISQVEIEETLRRYYRDCGWRLYNFDKLIIAIAKAAGTMFSDGITPDLMRLFEKDRKQSTTTIQLQLKYRSSAFKLLPKEKEADTYRITLNLPQKSSNQIEEIEQSTASENTTSPPSKYRSISLRVFDRDMPTLPLTNGEVSERYNHYVTSFAMIPPTENVPPINSFPFKPSHTEPDHEQETPIRQSRVIDEHISFEIGVHDYKIKFQPKGFEVLLSNRVETQEWYDDLEKLLTEDRQEREQQAEIKVASFSEPQAAPDAEEAAEASVVEEKVDDMEVDIPV